ncbi:hypothetical protein FGADI_3261 [Fusarium gaditjirri]|uniref:Uncharacterized protein n=1 Tax=Fusarium gaditjirri TaxID=282569 RepID=A0A8H4X185_9HYPO|nr:hypothetical protein FGADI_3261 [Fusarium gaditjirri]
MHFRAPPRTLAGVGSELIDASNDLIIICRPVVHTMSTTLPTVKYIGALYEPPTQNSQHPWGASTVIFGPTVLLLRFTQLRVLYILINPKDTLERMVGPPRFVDCMTDYHWDYKETVNEVPPKTFHARQRVYYELPKAITKTMCAGLERAIDDVRTASLQLWWNKELPRLVIRVMTWKDARGVRGRFDLG